MNPMYLLYNPPQMLPTQTLNPTVSSTSGTHATGNSRVKRDTTVQDALEPMNKNVKFNSQKPIDANKVWWLGVILTVIGGGTYLYS